MIRRLFNLALVILLAPALYAFTYEGVLFLTSVLSFDSTKWFLIGAALSAVGCVILLPSKPNFIEVLLHELEHAALAFLFSFKLPKKMEIDPEGTSKVVVVDRGGCLTTLAPYYFPLLTVPFLVLKALLALTFSMLKAPFPTFLAVPFDILIGATLVFHYAMTIREFGSFQKDISSTGLIPSLVLVLFLNFMFLVLSVTVVTGSYTEFVEYVKVALETTVDSYQAAFEFLKTQLLPAARDLIQRLIDLFCEMFASAPAP
jgi:hypothetical protein